MLLFHNQESLEQSFPVDDYDFVEIKSKSLQTQKSYTIIERKTKNFIDICSIMGT